MQSSVPTSSMLNIKPRAVSSHVETFSCESDKLSQDTSFERAVKLLEAYHGKAPKDDMIYA